MKEQRSDSILHSAATIATISSAADDSSSGQMANPSSVTFLASDGYPIAGVLFPAKPGSDVLIISSATAVPQRFYRRFASYMQANGLKVLTFDYRGIGKSAPSKMRGFEAQISDWGLMDIQAAVDFAETTLAPDKIFLMGHSAGGQQAGMITNSNRITAMVTVSAQSGYWRKQGGSEKAKVWFSVSILIPLLTRVLGYFPWSKFGGEDLPYHVALGWAAWCRKPNYLFDDTSLPLERYRRFRSPVLAYSIEDDGWGTKEAVHAMMSAYPNVSFEHLVPSDHDIEQLGHMGFFRKGSEALWDRVYSWLVSQ